ncbi:lysogeny pheromone AimP family peptide [Bacillus subtilis]|uniref:Lysogeny pheromone AimP family peptide n=1 Tax=Bacillus spizizenii TaxID=96241 RepID=A0A9Q4HG01_BACSC|nr:lysogeny pheromone AimP family peptide [Bacillus subtilis]MCY8123122.1 lysogeny pheromone AimP family peptide [Bacillus spizizenii]MBE1867951.1 lysogeny pheromone AimP family peptide [Bacillus subtilis]MBO3635091.1 lysogeny pheromone AimP family peptide [Bacillus subtilis]MDK8209050.1 lysogeny pheromone AimP family peptide [Bacillus subtilis]MDK8209091.1 lysogeny pheromone AimP family peptide [Bacillus subtilis]
MKKVIIGLAIVAALAIGFVGGQHSVNTASGDVQVASIGHGA